MYQQAMRVILGASSLKAYVTAPKALHVLGIVRFGQEFGLLATNSEGTFFRVNGSRISELDAFSVRRAMDCAQRAGERNGLGAPAHPSASTAPQVSVRKHRHVEMLAHA